MEGEISLEATPAGGGAPLQETKPVHRGLENTRQVFSLGAQPVPIAKVRLEVAEPRLPPSEPDHLEIREVTFRP